MIFQLPLTVALADDGKSFCSIFSDAVARETDLELVGIASTGLDAIGMVNQLLPDVLILDIILPGGDGLFVLETFRQRPPRRRPAVIAISGWNSDSVIPKLVSLGVNYYMIKPIDLDVLIARIKEFGSGICCAPRRRWREEQLAKAKLDAFGVPPNYKGYNYLRDAICYVVENPSLLNNLSTRLYPMVGRRYGASPSSVERSVRHAIEHAVWKGDQEFLEVEFGSTMDAEKGKPTNSVVIAKFADEIRLKLEMEGG